MFYGKFIVYPIELEFFEVLENKNFIKLLKFFIRKSLYTGKEVISVSYKEIFDNIKIYPEAVSTYLKYGIEKNYIILVERGCLQKKHKKRKPTKIKVNYKILNTSFKEYLEIYKKIMLNYSEGLPMNFDNIYKVKDRYDDIIDEGDKSENKQVAIHYKREVFSTKDEKLEKIKGCIENDDVDKLSYKDILYYFKNLFWRKEKMSYPSVIGRDLAILKRIIEGQNDISGITKKELILSIHWLFKSGQNKFKTPTIPLLGSRWLTYILKEAKNWENQSKKNLKKHGNAIIQ